MRRHDGREEVESSEGQGTTIRVALHRAHEQAAIHGSDRWQVGALIERLFSAEDVTTSRSAKSSSKLRPGL